MRRSIFYIWSSFQVAKSKYRLSTLSLFDLIWTAILFGAVFLFDEIPLFPKSISGYGAIWHVFHLVNWLFLMILSMVNSRFLFLLGVVAGFAFFVLDGVAVFLSVTTLFMCYNGDLPVECRETQICDILAILISVTLFLISLLAEWNIFYVLRMVWRARRKVKNE